MGVSQAFSTKISPVYIHWILSAREGQQNVVFINRTHMLGVAALWISKVIPVNKEENY